MQIKIEFCPHHFKMVTEDIPLCSECLKEHGFDIIEQQKGVYINTKDVIYLIEAYNLVNNLEEDYSWSLSLIEKLESFSKELKSINVNTNINAVEEKEIIEEAVKATSNQIGTIIYNFIQKEIAEKKEKDNE